MATEPYRGVRAFEAGSRRFCSRLIGDAVNVAPRVEQLTKATGDGILLTQQTVEALASRPQGLEDRGATN
jgi:class 3 adenylate cyclase